MALSSFLRKALKSPEMIAMLLGGGAGALVTPDDRGVGAASGAALGLGVTRGVRGVRGLLSRVPTDPRVIDQAVIDLRRAVPGITPQQSTQMPSNEFRDQVRNIMQLAKGQQRQNDLKRAWEIGSGVGAAGAGLGLGGYAAMKTQEQGVTDTRMQQFAVKALGDLGFPPNQYGVRTFQLMHPDLNLKPTGQIDEDTLNALLILHQKRQQNREVDDLMNGPPAPSLKPPMP